MFSDYGTSEIAEFSRTFSRASVTYNLSLLKVSVEDFTPPIKYDCRYHSQHLSDCKFQLGIRKNKPIVQYELIIQKTHDMN